MQQTRAGMSWSAFRPSDDAQTFGYSIPGNMYVAGALERVLELNRAVWGSQDFHSKASRLLSDITHGRDGAAGLSLGGEHGPRLDMARLSSLKFN